MPSKVVKAVIFDLDGLLLDTEPMYTRATEIVLQEFGKNYPWDVKAQMMGKPALEAARILVSELEITLAPEEYLRRGTIRQLEVERFHLVLPGTCPNARRARRWGWSRHRSLARYPRRARGDRVQRRRYSCLTVLPQAALPAHADLQSSDSRRFWGRPRWLPEHNEESDREVVVG